MYDPITFGFIHRNGVFGIRCRRVFRGVLGARAPPGVQGKEGKKVGKEEKEKGKEKKKGEGERKSEKRRTSKDGAPIPVGRLRTLTRSIINKNPYM